MSFKKGKGKIKFSDDVTEWDAELVGKMKLPAGAIDDLAEIDANLKVASENDIQSDGGRLVEERTLSSVKSGLKADMDANETARDASVEAIRLAIQNDVDSNEADADASFTAAATDRAAVRSEFAAADTAIIATATALAATVAANEIARDVSEAAAIQAAVDGLIDAAPGTMDTLNELAAALGDDADYHNSIATQMSTATTARTAIQADVDANEAAALAGRNAIQAALDTQEAKEAAYEVSNDAALAAVQADVDQNEADADAAIAAEETRALAAEAAIQADVDANEAAALAARNVIQADVDQNEADADAAIAALQSDVDQNEADADASFAAASTDRAAVRSEFAAADTAMRGGFAGTLNDLDLAIIAEDTRAQAAEASLAADLATEVAATNADFASATAARAAIQSDVDANEAAALAARNVIIADVAQNEADGDTDRAAIRSELAAEVVALLGDVAADYDNLGKMEDKLQVEQARVDAILAASSADKDSFAEIVTLINSVDLENDNALAAVIVDLNDEIAATNTDISAAATARASIQADVDQNEADADAAIAAEETRALAAEAALQSEIDGLAAGKSSIAFQTDGGALAASNIYHMVTSTQAGQKIDLTGLAEKELRVVKLTTDSTDMMEVEADSSQTWEGDASAGGKLEMYPGAVLTFVLKSGILHLL